MTLRIARAAGLQSIGRAFAILEEVARNRDGIALADLSKRVGLHNSTAFHLVKTMVSLGYIRQIKESKRYRIGRPLFALAASALDEMEMVSMATPVLDDLSRETGESSHFAARMSDAVVVMARTPDRARFSSPTASGSSGQPTARRWARSYSLRCAPISSTVISTVSS